MAGGSPSSRRAWIEIYRDMGKNRTVSVALLAEGVDRNCRNGLYCWFNRWSPSSRRAWIEICKPQ